jgi:hypothetical protein
MTPALISETGAVAAGKSVIFTDRRLRGKGRHEKVLIGR